MKGMSCYLKSPAAESTSSLEKHRLVLSGHLKHIKMSRASPLFLFVYLVMAANVLTTTAVVLAVCMVAVSGTLRQSNAHENRLVHDTRPSAYLSSKPSTVDWYGFVESQQHKNSKNIHEFVLNDCFFSSKHSKAVYTETDPERLSQLEKRFSTLKEQAENGTLTAQDKLEWQPIADALVGDFGNETGAIAFDQGRKTWIVCGWVSLVSTFVKSGQMTRMCTSCASVGMASPVRSPEPYLDYGEAVWTSGEGHGSTIEIRDPVEAPEPSPGSWWTNSEDRDSTLTVVHNEMESPESYQMVDLFTSTDESCASADMHDSCAAFCCTSVYRKSEFCGGSSGYCF